MQVNIDPKALVGFHIKLSDKMKSFYKEGDIGLVEWVDSDGSIWAKFDGNIHPCCVYVPGMSSVNFEIVIIKN